MCQTIEIGDMEEMKRDLSEAQRQLENLQRLLREKNLQVDEFTAKQLNFYTVS